MGLSVTGCFQGSAVALIASIDLVVSGSCFVICALPLNLTRLSLYGCANPSKTVSETYVSIALIKSRHSITFQPRQPLVPQPILWQHASNSLLQHFSTSPFCKHLVHAHLLQTPRPRIVCVVLFLKSLLAGRA
jgi:hypothetical protein